MANAGFLGGVAVVLPRLGMQGQPEGVQAGVEAQGQLLDAGVLEQLDGEALEGTEVVGHGVAAPALVGRQVGQGGPIAIDPPYPIAVVVNIRDADAQVIAIGLWLARVVPALRVGHQMFLQVPESLEIKVKLALLVGEEGAVALALEDGAAVGGLEAEILLLALRMLAVIAYAVIHPVAQATDAEMAQQLGHLVQHLREAGAGDGGVKAVDGARGPGHQLQDEADVALQQLQAAQAPRRLGDGLQEGQDGLAIGGARHLPDGLGDQFQAALPQLGGDPGHLLQIDQHGLEAAPDHADQGGPGEIGLDARGGQALGRLRHAVGEDLPELGEVTGQALAVTYERIVAIGHEDVPECRLGSCLPKSLPGSRGIRPRRWRRWRGREWPGCPRHR